MSTKRSLVRINAAEKRQAVVEARAKGHTWREVADITGYSSPESAQRAFNTALSLMPKQTVDELVAEETARLEMCDAELSRIIEHPPLKTTAIGKVVLDPRTGEYVVDKTVIISAIKERRLVGESIRRMRGADKPVTVATPDESAEFAEAMAFVGQITAEITQLRAANAALLAQVTELEGSAPADVVLRDAYVAADGSNGHRR